MEKKGAAYRVLNVPVIHQMPRYPTGCEAVAMTMLLQWAGKSITVDQVIAHMPRGPKPQWKDGVLHAPDPREAFVGNPYDDRGSFGIYHQPLLRMLELFFPGRAVNLTDEPWEKIEAHLAGGVPVVIWGTIKMLPMKPTLTWKTPAGDSFQWRGNEHAMTMVGFDDTHVFVNDPYTGRLEIYRKELFIDRWRSMFSQAISIRIR
ncbi:MAG TPA: C39 family peptidase [Spirochaetota bacterium]|nr:C39 family peptidase [Spirochaetota bacterium]